MDFRRQVIEAAHKGIERLIAQKPSASSDSDRLLLQALLEEIGSSKDVIGYYLGQFDGGSSGGARIKKLLRNSVPLT